MVADEQAAADAAAMQTHRAIAPRRSCCGPCVANSGDLLRALFHPPEAEAACRLNRQGAPAPRLLYGDLDPAAVAGALRHGDPLGGNSDIGMAWQPPRRRGSNALLTDVSGPIPSSHNSTSDAGGSSRGERYETGFALVVTVAPHRAGPSIAHGPICIADRNNT